MRLIDADKLKPIIVDEIKGVDSEGHFIVVTGKFCKMDNIDSAPTVSDRTEEVKSLQKTIRKLTKAIEENSKPKGKLQCHNCLQRAVIWDLDNTLEECGYDGNGIVRFYHCINCGANIEYLIPIEESEDE